MFTALISDLSGEFDGWVISFFSIFTAVDSPSLVLVMLSVSAIYVCNILINCFFSLFAFGWLIAVVDLVPTLPTSPELSPVRGCKMLYCGRFVR